MPITVQGHTFMKDYNIITFAGKSNWAVQGAQKGFYVNCEMPLEKS